MRLLRALSPLLLATVAVSCASAAPASSSVSPAATVAAGASATSAASSAASDASPATTCSATATPTIAMTEGPYYKAGAPERSSLVTATMAGTRIVVAGYVLTRSCQPVAGAKVDVWQADATGTYDNTGYTLRGYVLTDGQGRYRFETIVPGEYPGRTEHIHVKVDVAGSVLTTQLYFPGQASNAQDGIFHQENLLTITGGSPLLGRFDFVLDRP